MVCRSFGVFLLKNKSLNLFWTKKNFITIKFALFIWVVAYPQVIIVIKIGIKYKLKKTWQTIVIQLLIENSKLRNRTITFLVFLLYFA